jgi:hypothetical protein
MSKKSPSGKTYPLAEDENCGFRLNRLHAFRAIDWRVVPALLNSSSARQRPVPCEN